MGCSQNRSFIKFLIEYSFLLHLGYLRFPIIIFLHLFFFFTLSLLSYIHYNIIFSSFLFFYLKMRCSQNRSFIKFLIEYSFLPHLGYQRFRIIIFLHLFCFFTLKWGVVKLRVLLNF